MTERLETFETSFIALVDGRIAYDPAKRKTETFTYRRIIAMTRTANKDEQKRLYEALLELPWLAPKVRSAVMKELGLSKRDENRKVAEARAATIHRMIELCEARMRRNGERPRGGIHDAAVAEVAERQNMSVAALTKLLYRHYGRTARPRYTH
jgi:hypothetical protein